MDAPIDYEQPLSGIDFTTTDPNEAFMDSGTFPSLGPSDDLTCFWNPPDDGYLLDIIADLDYSQLDSTACEPPSSTTYSGLGARLDDIDRDGGYHLPEITLDDPPSLPTLSPSSWDFAESSSGCISPAVLNLPPSPGPSARMAPSTRDSNPCPGQPDHPRRFRDILPRPAGWTCETSPDVRTPVIRGDKTREDAKTRPIAVRSSKTAMRHRCERCDKPFQTSKQLMRHYGVEHKAYAKKIGLSTEFRCLFPRCWKVYTRRDNLTRHLRDSGHQLSRGALEVASLSFSLSLNRDS